MAEGVTSIYTRDGTAELLRACAGTHTDEARNRFSDGANEFHFLVCGGARCATGRHWGNCGRAPGLRDVPMELAVNVTTSRYKFTRKAHKQGSACTHRTTRATLRGESPPSLRRSLASGSKE